MCEKRLEINEISTERLTNSYLKPEIKNFQDVLGWSTSKMCSVEQKKFDFKNLFEMKPPKKTKSIN